MAWDTENAWRSDWRGRWRSHKPGQALVEQNVARPLLRVRNTGTTERLRLRNVQQKFSIPSANRTHAQRSLRVTPSGDGRFLLNGELPEESARLMLKALELCMAQARREADPSAEDLEELENPSAESLSVWEIDGPAAQRAAAVKLEQQNADALVDIAQVYLAGGTDAHHVVHWADGGETSLENTLLPCGLCRAQHNVQKRKQLNT